MDFVTNIPVPIGSLNHDHRAFVSSLSKRNGTGKKAAESQPAPEPDVERAEIEKAYCSPTCESPAGSGVFAETDVLDPPYPFDVLANFWESSNCLRQNVEAMGVGTAGFGFRFDPVMDFTHPEVEDEIRDILIRDRLQEKGISYRALLEAPSEVVDEIIPSPAEVEETKKRWTLASRIEILELQAFFSAISPIEPYQLTIDKTLQDLDALGNAAWEVTRDERGLPDQIMYARFKNLRLTKRDKKATRIRVPVREDAVQVREIEIEKRFRRFKQLPGESLVGPGIYFKEFGDPRVVSIKTGRAFETTEEMRIAEGPEARPTNEILHFSIPCLDSPYGLPRWIGNVFSVMGSLSSEKVNWLYFRTKKVPPIAVLVEDGRLSGESHNKVAEYFRDIVGEEQFHDILILEAVPAEVDPSEGDIENHGRTRIRFEKLVDAQQQDALFQEYDSRNRDKIGESFRLPRLLRGDMRDFNRATAQVAMAYTDQLVFQPARDRFDSVVNSTFVIGRGFTFNIYRTNAPVTKQPTVLTDIAAKLVDAGILTPAEGREIAIDILNRPIKRLASEDWTKRPLELTLAALKGGGLVQAMPVQGVAKIPEGEEGVDETDRETPSRFIGGSPIDPADLMISLRSLRDRLREEFADDTAAMEVARERFGGS